MAVPVPGSSTSTRCQSVELAIYISAIYISAIYISAIYISDIYISAIYISAIYLHQCYLYQCLSACLSYGHDLFLDLDL